MNERSVLGLWILIRMEECSRIVYLDMNGGVF